MFHLSSQRLFLSAGEVNARRRLCAAVASLTFALIGCNGDRPTIVPVSGQVLLDGKPLTFGMVQFTAPNSRPSYGNLDQEGRFQLTCREPHDGAVLGLHVVTINGGEVLKATNTSMTTKWHAPKKYADAATSGLTQEISEARYDLVLDIGGDAGKPFAPFVETVSDQSGVVDFGSNR